MRYVYLAIGLVVLAVAVGDLLWTTLWVDGGAGPLSSTLMAGIWSALRRTGSRGSTLLNLSGPIMVVATFVAWLGLLWAGWSLVFAAGEPALVDTRGSGVSRFDLVYFVAYTMFTLGIGDVVPREGVWQIATVLTTATGMLLITLSVSYVVSVLGAVSRKRSFASSVTALGTNPEQFVAEGWNGEDFDGFGNTLDTLAKEVDYLAYQYKAYPILHYYRTGVDRHAMSVAVAIFDDALTLLDCGVTDEASPNAALVDNAHASTENYVDTIREAFISPSDRVPPRPQLAPLRDAEIPTVPDETFTEQISEMDDRRRALLGLIETDEREWPSGE